MRMQFKKPGILAVIASLALYCGQIFAADHAEAPQVAADQAADIADVYAFLDPNDNTQVILAFDVHGFIVPGENGNFGGFDPNVLYRFNIENTGDVAPDLFFKVKFSAQTSRSAAQTATVTIRNGPNDGARFTADTTVSSATADIAPTPVVTTDSTTGISFFAGITDDPFFFDIPGFNRFAASVLGGTPDFSLLSRGRNTFAGYNVQMIALSVPLNLLVGSAGNTIGVSASTRRHANIQNSNQSDPLTSGNRVQIDRMGVPGVNTVFIPFSRKNEYNRATPVDDAAGMFASDIIATLTALGTDNANIGILADVAVTTGDQLRLDTSAPNTGPQGGTNTGAGFPNGRRPTDDVIDTIVSFVTNGGVVTGDNVDANDVAFRDSFPFFAPSQQPFPSATGDDNTRN